jgi:GNAT superfamily N-acetyltransferase
MTRYTPFRPLDEADRGYALFSMREGHKKSPGCDRVPWSYYKNVWGGMFEKIFDDPKTRLLGAYTVEGPLAGWLVMMPGKRVHTLHWVHVKHKHRRQGLMTALLDAAELGPRFAYTLHARRDRVTLPDNTKTKSLDESLVFALRSRGVSATFIPLQEYIK